MLEKLGKLITVGTPVLIAFSIIYDWSYFRVIDQRLFSAMSVSDHIASAMEVVPFFVIVVTPTIIFAFHFGARKERKGDLASGSILPLAEKGKYKWGLYVPPAGALWLLTLFLILLIVAQGSLMAGVCTILFIWWHRLCLPIFGSLEKVGFSLPRAVVFAGPAVLVSALLWGNVEAYWDLSGTPSYELVLEGDSLLEQLTVLRSSDKVLLVFDARNHNVRSISWSAIKELRNTAQVNANRGSLLCDWGDFCWFDRKWNDLFEAP
jgi:hypothetical protein